MKSHKSGVAISITNFYLHQPGNSVGSPLNQTHRQQLELLLTDDLLLQGNWGKEDAAVWLSALLYVYRNRRFIRDGSPGRPPRLSHGS